jgi:hypothetical protein
MDSAARAYCRSTKAKLLINGRPGSLIARLLSRLAGSNNGCGPAHLMVVESYTRILSGRKGTITIAGNAMAPWAILAGTRFYLGLRGRGARVVYALIRITMTGTVSQ